MFRNGTAARIEERLNSLLKATERHSNEFTRRSDHSEQDLKAMETGIRADLQSVTAALARIETLLKTRNGGAAKAGAAMKKTAVPAGYLGGGGFLYWLAERLL